MKEIELNGWKSGEELGEGKHNQNMLYEKKVSTFNLKAYKNVHIYAACKWKVGIWIHDQLNKIQDKKAKRPQPQQRGEKHKKRYK